MHNKIDITIKPTMTCNMKCKHCFNGDTFTKVETLDVNTACVFMAKACEEYQQVKVTFHGGEPTLAGIDFFKKFYANQRELQQQFGTKIDNLIVTNGLLLSNDMIDVFNEHNVLINISFDGPYNNILRQQTATVRDAIFRVREKGGRFKCFCTLSKESVPYLLEIYNWFKNNQIPFKTLPIEKRGYAKNNTSIIMQPEDLVEQFEKVYRIWLTDIDCSISFSTFEEFAKLRRNVQHRKFWFGRKIALNPDGKIYTFGRPNDIHYCMGSPYDIHKLNDCFENKEYNLFLDRLEKIRDSKCPKCDSFVVCGGVNINIAYLYENDPELVDYSCRQSNLLFQKILAVNDEIIEDFQKGHGEKYNSFVQKTFQRDKAVPPMRTMANK